MQSLIWPLVPDAVVGKPIMEQGSGKEKGGGGGGGGRNLCSARGGGGKEGQGGGGGERGGGGGGEGGAQILLCLGGSHLAHAAVNQALCTFFSGIFFSQSSIMQRC